MIKALCVCLYEITNVGAWYDKVSLENNMLLRYLIATIYNKQSQERKLLAVGSDAAWFEEVF